MQQSVLTFVDYDKQAINGIPLTMGEEIMLSKNSCKSYFKELFNTSSIDTSIDIICSCNCGELTGNFYDGLKCNNCGTTCNDDFVHELSYKGWFHIPDDLYLPSVLAPGFYNMLYGWLKQVLIQLLDPREELHPNYKNVLGQGYSYFYKNFDDIIKYLLIHHNGKIEIKENIKRVISQNRDKVFVRALPVLNSSLHNITEDVKAKSFDKSAKYVMKALITLSDTVYAIRHKQLSNRYIDRNMYAFYSAYIEYADSIRDDRLAGKSGFYRKHIYGTRYHCSARAVIIPHTTNHEFDEVYLPWKIGVTLYKLEILNILMNRYKYSLTDALRLHSISLVEYNKIIDDVLQLLISECTYKGLPVLCGRNPGLVHGAIMLLYVTKIKTSITDNCLSFSDLIVSAPNADYDGDQINIESIKEMDMVPILMNLNPAMVALTHGTFSIGDTIRLSATEVISLSNWINYE